MKLLLLPIVLWHFDHAFYVSVTDIKQVGAGRWEVTCRLFNNDLEDALRNASGKSVSLQTDEAIAQSAELVTDYVNSKLLLLDEADKKCVLSRVSGSAENDSVWLRFSAEATGFSSIGNTLLIELFAGQQNVVTLESGNDKRYFRFNHEVKSLPVE